MDGRKWLYKVRINPMYPSPTEFEENDLHNLLGLVLGDWSLVNNANYSLCFGS